MRIRKVYEKQWTRNNRGKWVFYAEDLHADGLGTWCVVGLGFTVAEAKKDLLCQKMRCDMKHAKKYRPVYEEII